MKALTIHQPYAALIVTPSHELPHGAIPKRVENRTWPTKIRGEILIHAGRSLEWFDWIDWPRPESLTRPNGICHADFPGLTFGALVGVAKLVDCVPFDAPEEIAAAKASRPWLGRHAHARGPFCWILDDVRRFREPIPYKGAQGFYDVPGNLVAAAIRDAERLPH